jgi:2-polyprenyl-3-methyl-5-hydroxy-6-metoxy-1,4-benzoquinol methylase
LYRATIPNDRLKDYKEVAIELRQDFFMETRKLDLMNFGRLLDIGCGLGLFLEAMKPFFGQVRGVEISDYQVHFCRRLGLNVLKGLLTELKLPAEYFDAVTMWDVLEHLPNPMEYLREISRILRKDGIIAISTPNFSCLTSRIVKTKWLVLNPHEHLFYFTPKTLKNMLENANFIMGKIKTLDVDIFNIYRALSYSSFNRRAIWNERSLLYSRLKKKRHLALLRKMANQILSESYLGDSIRAYAYKT